MKMEKQAWKKGEAGFEKKRTRGKQSFKLDKKKIQFTNQQWDPSCS